METVTEPTNTTNSKPEDVSTEETPPNQEEFTSEKYKIEIKNLPSCFGYGNLRKFFNSLNLKFVKIKAPQSSSFAFMTFVSEQAKVEAMKIINSTKYKGKQLEAVSAKPSLDPIVSFKRKNANNENEPSKQVKQEDNLTSEEKVKNATTPLWNLTYDKQVEQKNNHIKQILRKCFYKMEKIHKDTFYYFQKQSKKNEGMCCNLVEFVNSPVTDDYRNKCEFTIGYDSTETKKVIGFRLGEYKAGSNEVVEPYCLKNISQAMKSVVKEFQVYIEQSKYDPFNVRTRLGNWRQLTLRSNQNNEILAIVVFDKHELTEEEIKAEKDLLAKYFETKRDQFTDFSLTSLLFNLNTNKSGISRMDNLDLLLGEDYLYESLLNLKFRISPLAFFQANTKAAEILYSKIGEICDIDENTIILDICCGTGTIGLTLASKCKLVVGVEIIPEAIEDAKVNSELNNIKNVEWHCGKAEDILPNLLKRHVNDKVVAIVDPPRAGLHIKVIQALRHLRNLESLIYVSCNPELATQNFIDLSRDTSKSYVGEPFVPTKAIAVDMFPHTTHCELILYFKRYSNKLLTDETV